MFIKYEGGLIQLYYHGLFQIIVARSVLKGLCSKVCHCFSNYFILIYRVIVYIEMQSEK